MSSVLKQAEQIANQRAEQKAKAKKELIDKARAMIVAIAEESDPPTPDEILQLCDSLGVSLEWFDSAVKRCVARLSDVRGFECVPELKREAERLEAHAQQLELYCKQLNETAERNLKAVKNLPDEMQKTASFYREDVTGEELKAYRDSLADQFGASDDAWLAARDARRLRKEIAKLEKIDHSNVDHAYVDQRPFDFRLPPL